MHVFIITIGKYDEFEIVGVTTDVHQANEWVDSNPNYAVYVFKDGKIKVDWKVELDMDLNILSVEKSKYAVHRLSVHREGLNKIGVFIPDQSNEEGVVDIAVKCAGSFLRERDLS